MTTYDVLVTNELLPDFISGNTKLPDGFRIVGPVDGPAGYRCTRIRVEDASAPAWTDGKLIEPTFTADYDEAGKVIKTRVTSYRELDEEATRIASAVERAEDNPGHTVNVEDQA